MKKISKKKFQKILVSIYAGFGQGNSYVASYEAYGRMVCAYFSTPPKMTREQFEQLLTDKGCKVNKDYSPGSNLVEVTNISYFKAFGWDK